MKNRKIFIVYCLWILFVFSNSLQPADGSSEISQGLSYQIYEFLNLNLDFELFHAFIRKCAHFIEYAFLGVLGYGSFGNWKMALGCSCFVACFDEMIQLFVEGRSGQISDVVLDSCGVITSIVGMQFIKKIYNTLFTMFEKSKTKE